ncbi:unnamed protein product, partial [Discosporangium mesarthrocarpum]
KDSSTAAAGLAGLGPGPGPGPGRGRLLTSSPWPRGEGRGVSRAGVVAGTAAAAKGDPVHLGSHDGGGVFIPYVKHPSLLSEELSMSGWSVDSVGGSGSSQQSQDGEDEEESQAG